MAEARAASEREDRPEIVDLAGPLGAFHATAFLVVPVLALHLVGALGDLLVGLSTLSGIAAGLLLWGLTWAGTRSWLAGVRGAGAGAIDRVGRFCWRGALWGGAIGVAFFWVLLTAILANGLLAAGVEGITPWQVALFLGLGYGLGGGIAALVGGVVALVLAAVDYAALALSARIRPGPTSRSADPATSTDPASGSDDGS